jgi:hypothetical protein
MMNGLSALTCSTSARLCFRPGFASRMGIGGRQSAQRQASRNAIGETSGETRLQLYRAALAEIEKLWGASIARRRQVRRSGDRGRDL